MASWQQLPLSFSNQSIPSSFLIASLRGNTRGRIQGGGCIVCGLLGWNLAEVFSPKVQGHLVPDGTVLVGGAPRSWGTKQHLLSESPTPHPPTMLASGSEEVTEPRTWVPPLAGSHPPGA